MGVVVLRGASDKRFYADGGVMCGGMITIYSAKRIGTERAEFVGAA